MCPTACSPCFTSCTKRYLDKTITWAYDVGGNITSRKEYAFTTSTTTLGTPIKTYTYTYGSDWKDQLTSYNGYECVYDSAGNPTNYRWNTLTWEGRLLKSFKTVLGSQPSTMTYTADGLRASKVEPYGNGTKSHYYTYNGSTLVQEKIVTSGSQTTEYLTFLYNSEGPTGFVYNNTLYTYRKNIFGDIIAVYNGTSKVAEYAYDAYGNCRVITGSNIGTLNPFRYRGYYFDEDMKLYYLQSRYYDPETGRFINADDVSYLAPETIHGLNLYAYCLNNPVMYVDPSGHIAVSSVVIGLIIGVAIGLGAALYIDYSDDGQVFNGSVEWYHYLFAGTIGGLLGAVIGYLFPAISGFLNATFTFSLPTLGTVSGGRSLALVSGVTISFTGAQVAQGIAVVAGVTVMQAIIGKSGGYRVEIYNNDHDPAHVHIYGDNITGKHGIRIGIDGKPLPGQNKLPHGARKALKKLWKKILEKLLSWGN